MHKLTLFILLLTSVLNHSYTQNKIADNILGVWLSETKEGKIEVYRVGGKYYGKLIWSKNMFATDGKTSNKDLNNEDKKLRNRDLKNLVILNNLVFDEDEYTGGTIYDPKNGSTYKCYMTLAGDKLNIRGYIGISLIGRTSVWTRVK